MHDFSLHVVLLLSAAVLIGLVVARPTVTPSIKSFFRKRSIILATPDELGQVTVELEIIQARAIRSLLGSEIADDLMQSLASRLSCSNIQENRVAIDGDRIRVILAQSSDLQIRSDVEALVKLLSAPTSVAGIEFSCNAIASYSTQSSVNLNEPGAFLTINENVSVLQDLTSAVADGILTLEYQPKYNLRSGTIDSVEALLRWRRFVGSPVDIGRLIALAERTGTIKELSLWTLKKAIADGETFLKDGFHLEIFVNISGSLLSDGDFADQLIAAVDATDANIGIEITETAVIADPEVALSHLKKISQSGISIAIDDFGAGLSSLEYLQQLPAAELKIDRSFIATLSSSNRNPLIVKATIDLAHALEMKVTAEGVDDLLGLSLLKVMGCDTVQGYLISHPLVVEQLVEFVRNFEEPALTSKSLASAKSQKAGKTN